MGRILFAVFSLFLSACAPPQSSQTLKSSQLGPYTCQATDVRSRVLYGTDNRLDWYEAKPEMVEHWGRATLAIMPQRSLLPVSDTHFEVQGPSYQRAANLCPGQRFAEQTSAAVCTGFLIDRNRVVTAGHCVRSLVECQSLRFVFDFALTASGSQPVQIPKTSVYRCAEIIERRVGLDDYAVIRLERDVEDREPLPLRQSGSPRVGDPVVMVGHPMGLPSKLVDGGQILQVGERLYASVDAFLANSGSPIINLETGRVEGLLVTGEPDFVDQGGCRVERVCDGACRGEGLTPISKLKHLTEGLVSPPSLVCSFDR